MTIIADQLPPDAGAAVAATKRRARRYGALARLVVVLAVVVLATPAPGQTTGTSDAAERQFVFAYRLLERKNYELAAEAFDQYLDDFPRDEKRADGLYFRAYLAHMSGQDRDAARYLGAAGSTRLVKDSAVLLLKADVYGKLDRHDEAIKALEQIHVESLEPSLQARVFYKRGQTYWALQKLAAAEGQLKLVVAMDSPWRAAGLLDLARVCALQGRNNEALQTLEKCLNLGNTAVAAEAAHLAGDLAYQDGHFERAIRYYQIVMTRHTSSPHLGPALVGVLWSRLQARQYGELLVLFDQYKDDAALPVQERVAAYYLAGSARQELGEHDKAVELFGQVITQASGSALEDKLLYKLAASQFELGQYAPMRLALATLRKAHPDSPRVADADFLLAITAARQNDQAGGEAQLTAIVNAGPTHAYYGPALLQLAQLYESGGLLNRAEQNYLAFLEFAGDAQNADRVRQADVFAASLRLIHLQYRSGQYEQAQARAADLLQRPGLDPPSEAEALYRRARSLIQLKRYQAADDLLAELLVRQPRNRFAAEASYYRGLLLLALNKGDQATVHLAQAALSATLPEKLKVTALRTVATQWRQQGQDDQAAEALRQLEGLVSIAKLTPEEQLWLARYFTDQAEPQQSLKYLIPLIAGIDKVPGTVGAEAMLLSAVALRDLGESDRAIEALHEVVSRGPAEFGLRARLELARILNSMGRTEQALTEYDELLSADDADVQAAAIFDSALIYRDVALQRARQSDDAGAAEARKEARTRLMRIVVLFFAPRFSPLPELAHINRAEIAREEGRTADAGEALAELVAKYPDGPYAAYAKAMINVQAQKRSEARFLLQKLADQKLDERLQKRVTEALKAMEALR